MFAGVYGAVFRQPYLCLSDIDDLMSLLHTWELPFYGAEASSGSIDIQSVSMKRAAVVIGNEGNGISDALLKLCHKRVRIPMCPGCESLNAAVAASIIMWEMYAR